ncbi:NAD(P)H dehydrogenase (quinone) [Sphingomonas sp. PP-F2F-A104-K0414]|uniref:NAD(P)H-dependent oxidoreductase n=1 Tax=Sphingomonas sp. PP-F2F-A104-K0414 TaxID=2135661 RepID=UPI00104DC6AD|nr:NAD(P)H-dependent oxidoreductase [Sphingomonas sp. PP-F2F-A104-K0414]TCQ01033.1 NAD(P)H dehydrogenase (quinone) [Sphingomonas sp. PP-F2F-A104-K0414]
MSVQRQESRRAHVVLVMAHPAATSLTRSVTAAVVEALEALGHTAEVADLAAERFDPVFGPADHAAYAAGDPMPDDVLKEQRRIDGADHLVLVYPVYWWSMPALLKGWIDRVFVSGWAFAEDAEQGIVKKLGRLKVHLIALGGADSATYAKRGYRQAMQTQIEHGIFDFCGAPVVTSELMTMDRADSASLPLTAAQSIIRRLSP